MTAEHIGKIREMLASVPNRVYENPRYGKYYAGYGAGDVFTCESFFDTVFLYVTGNDPDGEFAANIVRLHVAAQNPETGHCNWRGGCWAHPHFFLMFALPRYGFTDEALDVADRIFDLTIDDPYVSEWHNAETGERLGAVIPAGVQLFQRLMPTLIRAGFDIDFVGEPLDNPLCKSPLPEALGL